MRAPVGTFATVVAVVATACAGPAAGETSVERSGRETFVDGMASEGMASRS